MTNELQKSTHASVSVEQEISQSYLDYAMSVIMSRALPDARDGLKPVHRRILYSMQTMGNYYGKSYKKSARVVGDVIGKYHPHGDSAIYESLVRMAQPFAMRYMLVDGQGNFGSIDGDPAAAMRYTEVRLQRLTESLLDDLDKNTVDFVSNYDESETMPSVLPTKIPNLLVNGSSGIAVGMATNIPPHNLTETINATLHRLFHPDCSVDDVMAHLPAPDFPTGGIIYGTSGLKSAYQTGRGKVVIRSKYHIESLKNSREALIITEIPYQINKARLTDKIVELVKSGRITGISEIRDESSKDGIRLVIELKRGENAEVLMNQLFLQTSLQNSFGINIVALHEGQPKQLSLLSVLDIFIRHRREVIFRRSLFELNKGKAHNHLLEGLSVAMHNVDPLIELIRRSPDSESAKRGLITTPWDSGDVRAMIALLDEIPEASQARIVEEGRGLQADGTYLLSERQAQAILDMRLHRLTALERDKLWNDYRAQIDVLKRLIEILTDPDTLEALLAKELTDVRDTYGDKRLSQIETRPEDFDEIDLVAEETLMITLSKSGYIKAQKLDTFRLQHRGGRGKSGAELKEEDIVHRLLVTSNHNLLLCFTDMGRVYWLPAWKVPIATSGAKGRPLVNLIQLQAGESVAEILPLDKDYHQSESAQQGGAHEDADDAETSDAEVDNAKTDNVKTSDAKTSKVGESAIVFATAKGLVKRTPLSSFARVRKNGLIAIALKEGDSLVGVAQMENSDELMLLNSEGLAIRFATASIRLTSRNTAGVIGMRMKEGAKLVRMLPLSHTSSGLLLTVCESGHGKCSDISEFPKIGRGGKGVIAVKTSARNGKLVSAEHLLTEKEILLISVGGQVIRLLVAKLPCLGRNTQGVRLVRLEKGDKLCDLATVPNDEPQTEFPL